MNYVYIDESGDLGFNEKGSNFFTISACLITDEITHKKFKRIPKKIRTKKLNKKLKLLSKTCILL